MTQHPPSPAAPADGTLLDVIPLADTGKVMMIVAHVVSAPAEYAMAALATDRTGTSPHDCCGPWPPAEPEIPPAPLHVDRASRRVWAGGREVNLTYQEFKLLDHLTAHPWTVFSRADLLTALWPTAVTVTRTVDVHVHRLRRKLGAQGAQLATVRRIGYVYRPRAASRETIARA
jgi:DNA-binding winged helix-turn-helix (wHTH) protein